MFFRQKIKEVLLENGGGLKMTEFVPLFIKKLVSDPSLEEDLKGLLENGGCGVKNKKYVKLLIEKLVLDPSLEGHYQDEDILDLIYFQVFIMKKDIDILEYASSFNDNKIKSFIYIKHYDEFC